MVVGGFRWFQVVPCFSTYPRFLVVVKTVGHGKNLFQ